MLTIFVLTYVYLELLSKTTADSCDNTVQTHSQVLPLGMYIRGGHTQYHHFFSVYVLVMVPFVIGLIVPPVVKRRGRPKGHTLTVTGLPAKRTRQSKSSKKRPISFRPDKERGVYVWVMHKSVYYAIM